MAAALLGDLKQKVKALTLIPAGGGCFEVSIDGEPIYSKLRTGTFPDEQTVLDAAREQLRK